MFWSLALPLDFEGAKNIHVLLVLIWGFGGHWRFLTGVWHPDIDLDLITGLCYTHIPNFGYLSWFWRWKEHPCPLSHDLRLSRMLEVPDLGFASWYWFGYSHCPSIHSWSKFWLSILILKVQRSSMSFKSSFGALEDAGGSWLGFCILILIWILLLVFGSSIFWILAFNPNFKDAKNIHVL